MELKTKLIVIAFSAVFSSAAVAQMSNQARILGVRLSGSGCSSATASAALTADGQTLSLLFDNYVAEIGVGSKNPQSTQIRMNCNVLVDMSVPFGYQYAISETNYQGFAAMPKSAFGLHRFTQIIPNQAVPTLKEAQLRGPLNSNYNVSVRQKPGREIYSQCNSTNQTVELLSELQLAYLPGTTDRSIAMINLDSIDTGVNSRFKLIWRKCP